MPGYTLFRCLFVSGGVLLALLLVASVSRAQDRAPSQETTKSLSDSLRELQDQVKELRAALQGVRAEAARARAETLELRHELQAARAQLTPGARTLEPYAGTQATPAGIQTPTGRAAEAAKSSEGRTTEQGLAELEEEVQLLTGKVDEQHQTKLESASKYRVRLSGIALLNLFANRGAVENDDFPGLAVRRGPLNSNGSVGGTLRQSLFGLKVFGPQVAGARTSAEVQFDFAGGFPPTVNGVTTGLVRLRTGTIRLDWAATSLVAGQDVLFLSPLSPASIASLAEPALSYAGNLWSWSPQVRIEHVWNVSEKSRFLVQGAILDALTGEPPAPEPFRFPQAGERTSQPAYGMRISWTHDAFGRKMTIGAAAYYSRQNWGFGRRVDGWAGMSDWLIPLGQRFELSGEFYRGRAVGGIGGGIGRSVLLNRALSDPTTIVRGLNSIGGWMQLKFRPLENFEVNGAFGQDNPFAEDIRGSTVTPSYFDPSLVRNRSSLANFIYRPRSNLLLSLEFRRLRTFFISGESVKANHLNLSTGYTF